MKKFLITIILFTIIILSFGYSYLKVTAFGSEENYFNRELREKFASSKFLRKVIGLHYDGDAKEDYLGKTYDEIEIAFFTMGNLQISQEALEIFGDKVEEVTGKKVNIVFKKRSIFKDFSNLENLSNDLSKIRYSSDKAVLYVFIENNLEGEASRIGTTLMEDGIVFFQGGLLNKTIDGGEKNLSQYMAYTFLHEFGHQIGLDHNENDGCLMNSVTEYGYVEKEDIVNDFCDIEKDEIAKIKKLY